MPPTFQDAADRQSTKHRQDPTKTTRTQVVGLPESKQRIVMVYCKCRESGVRLAAPKDVDLDIFLLNRFVLHLDNIHSFFFQAHQCCTKERWELNGN